MRLLAASSLILLAACTTTHKPPVIAYDDVATPAQLEPGPPQPVQVVEVPQPLPLPGQLKPAPQSPAKGAEEHPASVSTAMKAARVEPSGKGFIDAIQVWSYHPGALYQVYTAMGNVTDIALEPGEELTADPAGGDTERWEVGSAESGAGEAKQVHLLVKPKRPDLSANMVVTTNRRTYHIELHSTSAPGPKSATYLAAVSWEYPLDLKWKLDRHNKDATTTAAVSVDDQVDLQHLHHRYKITGDTVPWRPKDAWDDERKVYIEMPSGLAQGDAPPLFIIGPKGKGELVNYRVRGRWYVVDLLFGAAELRMGTDPPQVIRIARTDGIASN